MATTTIPITSFKNGEISPLLAAAVNTEVYQYSCRSILNWLVSKQGHLYKRPGTVYCGTTKSGNTAVFMPFRGNDGEYFILEHTALVCRIWKEDLTLFESGGSPLEVVTPYTEAQLKELNYAVDTENKIWIVHRSHAPRIITYTPATPTFAISIPTFTGDRTFNSASNYPGAICFYAGRLWLGGTINKPSEICGSRPPVAATGATQYLNFTTGTATDNAIVIQEADLQGTQIQWLAVQKRLIAGTLKTIWMSDGAVPTPATFDLSIQTYHGCQGIQAQLVDGVLCYVGRNGLSLRVAIYSDDRAGLVENNIAKRSEHIIKQGITSFAIQTVPDTVIWLTLGDGTLAACFIDVEENMIAWTRHDVGGFVEFISNLQTEDNDKLFMCVKRTINGSEVRYVEVLHGINPYGTADADDHLLDCGIETTTADGIITGLDHLEGEEVQILADAAIKPVATVTGGEVEISGAATKVHVGLKIAAAALLKKLEVPAKGTSQGKMKRIEEAVIRVYNTKGGAVAVVENEKIPLLTDLYGEIKFGETPAKYTGDIPISALASAETEGNFYLYSDDPVEINILGVYLKVDTCEP